MTIVANISRVRRTYTADIDLPCCTAGRNYDLTVTANDKHDREGENFKGFTIAKTTAFTVTNVNFGTLNPGQSSGVINSNVKNQGNGVIKFTDPTGIVPSNLISTANPLNVIGSDKIIIGWVWTTVILCNTADNVGFNLTVPDGTPAETFGGTITFTATLA